MKCPACDNMIEEITVQDIKVDVCKDGCGGIWFDSFELQKVDEPHESLGESLLDIEKSASVEVDNSNTRTCPRCTDTKMLRHFFSVKKEVTVDECPKCAGIWLDYGELGEIRSQFESEEERKKAAESYFQEIFGNKLDRMRQESEEKLKKARKIANAFRFICPTYYIPGKQNWGAF
ncbi:hypothetical protein D1AOALGA4SA_2571 [Olavius algarvensis Delta 1 endosymbiont]|nr:hypothetical protein D1AOALGA4SA_2571 [Olavius algarvensis Delta 1 endosymbiont]